MSKLDQNIAKRDLSSVLDFYLEETTPEAYLFSKPSPALSLGDTIIGRRGRYTITKLLSELRSEIYHARSSEGVECVVKKYKNSNCFFREKFMHELLSAQGGHQNILPAYEFLEEEQQGIFPYIKEGSLKKFQHRAGALTPRETVPLITALCDGVEFLHQRGIIHNDLKLGNVLVECTDLKKFQITREMLSAKEPSFLVKIFDFDMSYHPGLGDLYLDILCSPVGTLQYMAPEKFNGNEPTAPSDIYSLGIIMYDLLTGRYPYEGTEGELYHQHLKAPVPNPRTVNYALPESISEVIVKALAKNPDDRYQSAAEFKDSFLSAMG